VDAEEGAEVGKSVLTVCCLDRSRREFAGTGHIDRRQEKKEDDMENRISFDRIQIVRELGRAGRFLDRAALYARDKSPLGIATTAFCLAITEDQVQAGDGPPPSYDRLTVLREIARAPQFLDQAVEILRTKLPPGFHRYVTDFDIGRLALALAFEAPIEPVLERISDEITNWIGYEWVGYDTSLAEEAYDAE
jgi:hypothetical protein